MMTDTIDKNHYSAHEAARGAARARGDQPTETSFQWPNYCIKLVPGKEYTFAEFSELPRSAQQWLIRRENDAIRKAILEGLRDKNVMEVAS